ncbi:MAG: hypothetical protein GX299_01825 [Epulopiscium sp.]|nr:hypothetical protein [Candidatus Epulonipiscium sp.]
MIVLCFVGILFFNSVEEGKHQQVLLERYGEEQLLLIKQVVAFSENMSQKGETVEEVLQQLTDYFEENVTSGSRYWILCQGRQIVFYKNNAVTKQYIKLPITNYFPQEENINFYKEIGKRGFFSKVVSDQYQQKFIISSGSIQLSGQIYHLMLCTSKDFITNQSQTRVHHTYITLGILLLGAVSLCSVLLFHKELVRAKREIFSLKQEVLKKNCQVSALSSEKYLTDEDSAQRMEAEERKMPKEQIEEPKVILEKRALYRQYRLKFYLNAYHSIMIDGKEGDIHPHTWQVMIQMVKQKDEFVLFNEIEDKIDALFAKYQDQTINTIAPFDTLNPSLENISEYFKNEITVILQESGWILTQFECSETPTRSYLIEIPFEIQ